MPVARPVEVAPRSARPRPQPAASKPGAQPAAARRADGKTEGRPAAQDTPNSTPKRSRQDPSQDSQACKHTKRGKGHAESNSRHRRPTQTIHAAGLVLTTTAEPIQVQSAPSKPFAALIADKVAEAVTAAPSVKGVKSLQADPAAPAPAAPTPAAPTPAAPAPAAPAPAEMPPVQIAAVLATVQATAAPNVVPPKTPAPNAPAQALAQAAAVPAVAKPQTQPNVQPAEAKGGIEQPLAPAATRPAETLAAMVKPAEVAQAVTGLPLATPIPAHPYADTSPKVHAHEPKVAAIRTPSVEREARATAAGRFQAAPAAPATPATQTVARGVEVSIQNDTPIAAAQVGRAEPAPVDGQAGVSAAAPAADRTPQETMVSQVAEQIQANADRLNQQIEIRLHPPELGTVRLTLKADGSEVRGEMKVSDPDTAAQLQAEAPGLVRRLADGGIQMRRLDISLDSHTTGDQGNSPLGNPHGHPDRYPESWRGGFDADPASSAAGGTDPQSVLSGAYVTDQSINVWM